MLSFRILASMALAALFMFAAAKPVSADLVSVSDASRGWSLNEWGLYLNSSDQLKAKSGVNLQSNPNFYNQANGYSDNYSSNLNNVGNSNLSPTASYNGFTYWYNYEDDTDNTLGPHTGGQDYDGEFLGVGYSGAYLAVAIVTGQRPDNGFSSFAPGDLRIETSLGSFGIELTGYTFTLYDNGTTKYRKETSGKSYDSDGDRTYSNGSAPTPRAAGTIVSNADWMTPPNSLPPATPVQLSSGTVLGNLGSAGLYAAGNSTQYKNSNNYWKSSSHTIYELLIPLSYFGVATIESVHWAPSCGNDLLDVNMNVNHMPEPGSLALAGFAGIGFALRALRRRRSSKSDQAA